MKLVVTIPLNQARIMLQSLNDAFLGFVLVFSQNELKVYKEVVS